MKRLQKIIATAVLALLLAAGVTAAVRHNAAPAADGKLHVVASYYPLYNFAAQVAGSKADVQNITPAGAEPHDYEPPSSALAGASRADVFIYNGGTMESWVRGFLSGYHQVAVKASTGISLHAAADEDDPSVTAADPHFWLDPVLAARIVDTIRQGLAQADPADAAYFAANATAYKARLAQLDAAYAAGLASCQTRTIVTSHAAFGYLAARYNLQVITIAGLSPDAEPSAAKLAEITRLVRSQDIRYIFFEQLASPRLADTIAAETGAQTLVFDPIEGLTTVAQQQGKDYISVQYDNLASLRRALACR